MCGVFYSRFSLDVDFNDRIYAKNIYGISDKINLENKIFGIISINGI